MSCVELGIVWTPELDSAEIVWQLKETGQLRESLASSGEHNQVLGDHEQVETRDLQAGEDDDAVQYQV